MEYPEVIGTVKTIDSKRRIVLTDDMLNTIDAKPGDRLNIITYNGAIVARKMPKGTNNE